MKWTTWFDQFMLEINQRCVFSMNELKEAWKKGKTPKQIAFNNDCLASEYDELQLDVA